MDTVEFFDLILPADGWLCLAVPFPSGGYKHIYFESTALMAQRVQELDAKGVTVYHACSSFADKSSRTQANVLRIRSFWLDVDVGDDPRKYATFKDACYGVLGFAQAVGLPQPYIIKSGRGAHVYWPLTADQEPETWRTTASMLKAACTVYGLKADPSRTSDHASVLRPVGSTHRKGEPKPVALKVPGAVSEFDQIDGPLLAYLETNGGMPDVSPADDFPLAGKPADLFGAASNDDLTKGMGYEPRFADKVADACGVMDLVRQTKGNIDQPTWYHALGVLAFMEDGDAKAHEWSAGHPDYTPRETDAKLSQVRSKQSGPTSCAKLGEHQSAVCALCPHAGKIKTPAMLGTGSRGSRLQIQAPSAGSYAQGRAMGFPDGFKCEPDPRTGKKALRYIFQDEKGLPQWETFCRTIFYPVSRIEQDGEAVVEFERILPQDQSTRRFTISGAAIGKGKESWAGILGSNEIVPEGPQGAVRMDSMLKKWMHDLTETAAQVQSHNAFGWSEHDRSFVIAEDVLQPGNKISRAIVTGPARQQIKAMVPAGDLQTWVDTIDRAYNAPGQQGYQFMVACGFAAPLLRMNPGVNGITVYAHSSGSGVGKTTAAQAALSIWGHPDTLQLSEGKATEGSLWALMGCYKSVPVVFDELTNMDPRAASALVFSVSSGRAKQRLRSDGDLRQNNSNWRTIMLATGNNLLSEKLSLHRGNAEAEMSRLFEYTLDVKPHMTPNEALNLFPNLQTHYGHAGRVFMRYVVENYDAVANQVQTVRTAFNTVVGITQKERFWSALMASILVSTSICNKLGLLDFDIAALKGWIIQRLTENRTVRVEVTTDPLELIGKMLGELMPGVLVTDGEGDVRSGSPATVITHPRGALIGRAIVQAGVVRKANFAPVLLISQGAIKEWAGKKGVSGKDMIDAAINAGWASPTLERYSIGRGTVEYGAQSSYVHCLKLYPDIVGAAQAGADVAQRLNVVGSTGNAGATGQ